ncbi:winged helix-turn-helix domain-containing protein [Novosphingobium sp. AP12]|uniref:ATP-binding protein n=1 Tax=Novosphingobium sp. AP12 TaxID=1144305 RepID=UPI000271E711|nr:winged helix-turn-helix domain-containing protein [Novosphingobium sp. AP12]EJL33418.1 putative ATPase [Novosphingobium sp. AP12]
MLMEPTEECYEFASFRLYPKLRTLKQAKDTITIGGRAFDMLLALVSQAGVVVSLSDLMKAVWPQVTVEEANLRVQMGTLRKILAQCDDAQRAIETIPLRGYCFILPVRYYPHGMETPASATTRRRPLPTLLNRPIGRDETIEGVLDALAENRLVTLSGPGGIGKTTVAVATANRYELDHEGKVVFIDLSHVVDGFGAAEAIAGALGLDAGEDPVSTLCVALEGSDSLVVLDTCEHIVEPIAELAELLLAHCIRLKLLVTSREVLRAAGEWTLRLLPLTFPEKDDQLLDARIDEFTAMTMFIDRIRSTTPFSPEARHLPVVGEICRRLDGIPLALELAAARVADLGLHEIAANLDDCLTILTRGRRTALPRHRTLSATLDWSYNLLSGREQQMMQHLSSYSGSFAAKEAIQSANDAGCDGSEDALISLFEKSLLTIDMREDTLTYRLLDTTRSYVASL